MRINYKSGYFWGAIFSIIFLATNVIITPIVIRKADEKLAKIDFSQLTMKTLSGEEVTLKELSKGKKVFLNFWATWCGPCLAEFPVIQRTYENTDIKDEFVFVMISDEKMKTISNYVAKNDFTFAFAQVESFKEYGVIARPTTVVLDTNLTPIETIKGMVPYENADDLSLFLKNVNFNVDD